MGCDIHTTYEIRQEDGTWKALDWEAKYVRGEYADGSKEYDFDAKWKDPLHVARNYALFAILADVRNYPPPHGLTPIAAPRGTPSDASPEAKQLALEYGINGHSHSWLTLAEIDAFGFEGRTIELEGVVGAKEFEEYDRSGRPSCYCAAASSASTCTNSDMRRMLAGSLGRELTKDHKTVVRWTETYAEAVGKQWCATLDALREYGVDNVRLVFFFDN